MGQLCKHQIMLFLSPSSYVIFAHFGMKQKWSPASAAAPPPLLTPHPHPPPRNNEPGLSEEQQILRTDQESALLSYLPRRSEPQIQPSARHRCPLDERAAGWHAQLARRSGSFTRGASLAETRARVTAGERRSPHRTRLHSDYCGTIICGKPLALGVSGVSIRGTD